MSLRTSRIAVYNRSMRYVLLVLILTMPAYGQVSPWQDEASESATRLLSHAVDGDADMMGQVVLRALREFRDPQLEPLFTRMLESDVEIKRVHGILGLAEISDQREIDLSQLARIKDKNIRAQVISVALDEGMLSISATRDLLGWADLENTIKGVLAAHLIQQGVIDSREKLESLVELKGSVADVSVYELLALQVSGEASVSPFAQLRASDEATRLRVSLMLLGMSIRFDLDRVGPWAMQLATVRDHDPTLRLMGLRAAMKFGVDGAAEVFVQRYREAENDVDRMRLSLLALDVVDRVDPKIFTQMLDTIGEAEDITSNLLRAMSKAGQSAASESPDGQVISELVKFQHIPSSRWALRYAESQPRSIAEPILTELILAGEGGGRFRSQRLEHVVLATEALHGKLDKPADVITGLFRRVEPLVAEAMLMGLIRCRGEQPHRVIEEIETWTTPNARAMAILVKAKYADELTVEELQELALIVRGGTGLLLPLRTQSAWIYLKRTQQQDKAMALALRP